MSFWTNKVVMITGASSGIGRGLALDCCTQGSSVGVIARRAEALADLVSEIEAANGKARALPGDVQDETSIRAAADQLRSEFGRIDILIANAGVATRATPLSCQLSTVANVINTNVIGAANSVGCGRAGNGQAGEWSTRSHFQLAAYRGLPKSAAYCASKAAVSAFFESLRLDLATARHRRHNHSSGISSRRR